jgi:hypothetical protein
MLEPAAANAAELVKRLSRSLQLDDKQWQVGSSKVFMKKGLSEKLQGLVKTRVRAAIRTAQVSVAVPCVLLTPLNLSCHSVLGGCTNVCVLWYKSKLAVGCVSRFVITRILCASPSQRSV